MSKQSRRSSLASIKQATERATQIELEISLLLEELDDVKRKLPDEIALLLSSLPYDQITGMAYKLYWTSKHLATPVRTAFHKLMRGQGAFSQPPKEFEFTCEDCQCLILVKVNSWTDLKEHTPSKTGKVRACNHICPDCYKERRRQEQRSREETNKRWEERSKEKEEQIKQLRAMPYPEYLLTEHWKAARYNALRRAGFCCQLCPNKTNLQVHHRTYEHRGYEWPEDLIVLCKPCHQRHHGIIEEATDA